MKVNGKFLGKLKQPTDLPFFYTQKLKARSTDDVKIFYVRYRAAGAGTDDDARTEFYAKKKWGDHSEKATEQKCKYKML